MIEMRFLLGILALVTFSCQNIKERPISSSKIATPNSWAAAQKGQHARISTGWLKEFRDPRMTNLVKEALKNNYNLQRVAFQLKGARESTIIGRADRLPSITSSASNSFNEGDLENYSISLTTRWEVDLWGRLRNNDLANRASYAAQLANYRGVRLSLAANTARAWCNLVTAERQLELAKTTLASYQRALPAVERGYLATTLRAVDLQFARSNIASAERDIRSRQLNRDNAARSLEIFLGRYPSSSVASSRDLPTLREQIPVGLPASLLERRPDLAEARAQIYASSQTADSRRKALLPSISLSGSARNNASSIPRVLDPTFLAYSAAASLSQTIYNGGRLKASARQALAQNKAAIMNYARLAQSAFNEVESALSAETSLREQEIFLTQEVKQTTSAESRTLRDITLGVPGASFLDYLEAQRRAGNARASLIRLRNTRLLNRIDLHLALGGDFSTNTP